MRYRTSCSTKLEEHELITHLGCYNTANVWLYFSEAEVIQMIENDGDTFYVERPSGHVVEVVVATRKGVKYLKTEADGEKPNNLLSLPSCPSKTKSVASTIGALGSVVAAPSHGPEKWW